MAVVFLRQPLEGHGEHHRPQAPNEAEGAVEHAGAVHPLSVHQAAVKGLDDVAQQGGDQEHPDQLVPAQALGEGVGALPLAGAFLQAGIGPAQTLPHGVVDLPRQLFLAAVRLPLGVPLGVPGAGGVEYGGEIQADEDKADHHHSLPEELRADSGGKDRMFGFNSLSEVGEYLGVQLLDNPKLDQLEPYKQPILFNGEAAVKEPYLLMVHGDPAQVLDLHANYLLIERRPDPAAQYGGEEDYFVQFRSFLYTDAADFQEAERDPRGFYINTKGSAQVEEYVTPNGLVSAIITETGVNWPDRDYVQQVAYFATDYAYFSLTIYYYNDGKAETARTMLMELLDAFK